LPKYSATIISYVSHHDLGCLLSTDPFLLSYFVIIELQD
jgi:hypothetical protein